MERITDGREDVACWVRCQGQFLCAGDAKVHPGDEVKTAQDLWSEYGMLEFNDENAKLID
jgi:hypothetical protein